MIKYLGSKRILAPILGSIATAVGAATAHNPTGQRVGQVSHLRHTEYLFVAGPSDRVEAAVAAAGQHPVARREVHR